MRRPPLSWFFLAFFVSGFCGLVYEIVWLRLAMAQFGVTMAQVSLFLSAFMAGLGLGSWGAGRLAPGRERSALLLYGAAELVIAACGPALPAVFRLGRELLNGGAAWGSWSYFAASGAWTLAALAVPCVCMGATIPLAMSAIRALHPGASPRSFSYLYMANVLGAACGAAVSAFVLVELLGFQGTLNAAAALNAALGAAVLLLARSVPAGAARPAPKAAAAGSRRTLALLFSTGCAGMAVEVIWGRLFTAYVGTYVYAFAGMLSLYLAASFAGAQLYRSRPWPRSAKPLALALVGVAGCLTFLWLDPRLPLSGSYAARFSRLALSVVPFCLALGFVTPMLVDELSGGDPRRAGTAYAANVLGSIAGPLLAGFCLLPQLRERWALLLLMLPFLAAASASWRPAAFGAALALAGLTYDFEGAVGRAPNTWIARDSSATVIGWRARRREDSGLAINGIGTTSLNPATKIMAHLPLLYRARPARSGLVICFGMGTSFRSMLSWGVPTTVVELVPSVPGMIGLFHEDGAELLRSPLGRVVIDDGRRFLERSRESFDVIVVDPPPPEEAAGSSLLYSREFYQAVRRRLSSGGVLQQWHQALDPATAKSVALAITAEFRHVRAFAPIAGQGWHFLASDSPIPEPKLAELLRRLPPKAARDLVEWGPETSAAGQLARMLGKRTPVDRILSGGPPAVPLADDRPFNEYFFLRRFVL